MSWSSRVRLVEHTRNRICMWSGHDGPGPGPASIRHISSANLATTGSPLGRVAVEPGQVGPSQECPPAGGRKCDAARGGLALLLYGSMSVFERRMCHSSRRGEEFSAWLRLSLWPTPKNVALFCVSLFLCEFSRSH